MLLQNLQTANCHVNGVRYILDSMSNNVLLYPQSMRVETTVHICGSLADYAITIKIIMRNMIETLVSYTGMRRTA